MSNPTHTLVFDIETIGEDFDALDEATQEVLTRWIKREAFNEDEYRAALKDLKEGLGFSPLTGEIVAIGILDAQENKGAVYYQTKKKEEETEEKDVKLKPMSEEKMLREFWRVADEYNMFVSFNGRSFDVPFLMVRSAVHGIRPSKNLNAGRYLNQQSFNALHIDLLDQMSFYGAVRRKGNLHLWSRAFNIESPKASGVKGDDVGALFKAGKYVDIARYNIGDLHATKELYEKWDQYFRF
jgi:3'-5' exonuclease